MVRHSSRLNKKETVSSHLSELHHVEQTTTGVISVSEIPELLPNIPALNEIPTATKFSHHNYSAIEPLLFMKRFELIKRFLGLAEVLESAGRLEEARAIVKSVYRGFVTTSDRTPKSDELFFRFLSSVEVFLPVDSSTCNAFIRLYNKLLHVKRPQEVDWKAGNEHWLQHAIIRSAVAHLGSEGSVGTATVDLERKYKRWTGVVLKKYSRRVKTGRDRQSGPKGLVDSSERKLDQVAALIGKLKTSSFCAPMPPLLDNFGRVHRYLRISLTDQCNLRCGYCMPEEAVGESSQQVSSKFMTSAEIQRLVSVFVNRCGVRKIRFTGGEPLLRGDFEDVLSAVRVAAGPEVSLCLSTNGVLLKRYFPSLVAHGVRNINVSLDTLDRAKFPLISHRSEAHWDRAKEGVDLCLSAGEKINLKINTVAMNHLNDDEWGSIVRRFTKEHPVQVRFIELMPFAGNSKVASKLFVGKEDILKKIAQQEKTPLEKVSETDLLSSSTGTTLFRLPQHKGTFGVISSMSDAFCGACDRLRLTADGQVRNCLFSRESEEKDLLGVLRRGGSEDELESVIRASVFGKFFAHGGHKSTAEMHAKSGLNRAMVRIGG